MLSRAASSSAAAKNTGTRPRFARGADVTQEGCQGWRDAWRRVAGDAGRARVKDGAGLYAVSYILFTRTFLGVSSHPSPPRGELRGRLSVIHLTCEVLHTDPEVHRAYADGGYAVAGDKKACQHVRVNRRWH